jgi:hypothetical protein
MILNKTRSNSVSDVKALNMWGFHIRDISIFEHMPNIEILALSINDISSLRHLQYCTNLRDLLLRQNAISDFNELRYLQNLKSLRNLNLSGNPIADKPNYKETVLALLPQLTKLDDQEITRESRPPKLMPQRPRHSLPASAQADLLPIDEDDSPPDPVPRSGMRRQSAPPPAGASAEPAILAAVLSLLPELGPDSLSVVLQAIADQRK